MAVRDEVFSRKPEIKWREEEEARREALAALEGGSGGGDEGTLMIVDSGQIFELNLLGAEIWKLCDGRKKTVEIVDELLENFEVGRDELERDVEDFLREMEERGWLVRERR